MGKLLSAIAVAAALLAWAAPPSRADALAPAGVYAASGNVALTAQAHYARVRHERATRHRYRA